MTGARRVVLLLVLAAPALLAQDRMCDMSIRSVSVRLLTTGGAPVRDAAFDVRRVLRRTLIREARSLGDGSYVIVEDGAVPDLKPGGEPFDITFRRHDRQRRVRLIIGMDAAGCHVALKGGRTTIRL